MTDFSSIDRLMEFGLGIGLARQMIETMNYSIGNMAVPGVGLNCNQLPQVAYYAIIDNTQTGPVSITELIDIIKMGKITTHTLMWYRGLPGWRCAGNIPEVYKLILLNNAQP